MVHSQSLNPFQDAPLGRKSGSNRSLSSLRGSSRDSLASDGALPALPDWLSLPDEVVVHIFSFLDHPALCMTLHTCRTWYAIGSDESLWKALACRRWKLDPRTTRLPAYASSWKSEYVVLHRALPRRTVQTLSEHTDEVLHVAFSNNGRYLASCSKDRMAILWEVLPAGEAEQAQGGIGIPMPSIPSIITSNPITSAAAGIGGMARGAINNITTGIAVGLGSSPPRTVPAFSPGGTAEAHEGAGGVEAPRAQRENIVIRLHRRITFDNPTEYAEFNAEDTMVLIATANYANNYGAVHICRVSDAVVFHRVNMFPFDVMSAWAPDNHFVTAITRGLASTSSEIYTWWVSSDPEEDLSYMRKDLVPIDRGSCARRILVADLRRAERLAARAAAKRTADSSAGGADGDAGAGPSTETAASAPAREGSRLAAMASSLFLGTGDRIRRARRASVGDLAALSESDGSGGGSLASSNSTSSSSIDGAVSRGARSTLINALNVSELISGLLTGRSRAQSVGAMATEPALAGYQPRSSVATAPTTRRRGSVRARRDDGRLLLIYQTGEKLNRIGLKEIAAPDALPGDRAPPPESAQGVNAGCEVITECGPIIGMSLSPDHTQLLVNVRPFLRNEGQGDPALEPGMPLISDNIEVHVWDLATRTMVRRLLGHRAFTPADAPFIIWVSVGGLHDEIVVSGAEDGCGHLWHRHYGAYLGRLEGHVDVVNAAACNPSDPSMIVTASDDFTLRVWR